MAESVTFASSFVYSAADTEFDTNVPDRYGFLMQVKLGIIEYESKPLISSCDE